MHNQNEFAPLVLYSVDSDVKYQHLYILATQFSGVQTKFDASFKVRIIFLGSVSYSNMCLVFSNVSYTKHDNPYPEPVYTGWSSVHWNATGMPLVDPVYTGIPLGRPANTCRYTGTPLEKLSLNSPTLECHWRNLVESAPHWNATGETLTFAAYTGRPLEGLWQPTYAPTHIAKHAE